MSQINKKKNCSLYGRRALFCEDHPVNRVIVERILKREGVQLDIAVNGQDGVDTFLDKPLFHYDFILTDYQMPKMNGIETVNTIRKQQREDGKSIPFILLTANEMSEKMKEQCEKAHGAYLKKPVEPRILLSTIGQLLMG